MNLKLGKVGIWTFDFDQQPMEQVREEVEELEEWRILAKAMLH